MKKIGFIGMGNMAQALAAGFIQSGAIDKSAVFAFAPHQDKLKANAERIGFTPAATLNELADTVDRYVGKVRDTATSKVVVVVRAIVFGLVCAVVAVATIVLSLILGTKLLQRVVNIGGNTAQVSIFLGSDIYLASSDSGRPFLEPTSSSPGSGGTKGMAPVAMTAAPTAAKIHLGEGVMRRVRS